MEFEVTVVLGLVDSLETTDEVLMDVAGEWLRGLDLVVGGCVEVKDSSRSGNDLENKAKVKTGKRCDEAGHNCNPRSPFRLGRPGMK